MLMGSNLVNWRKPGDRRKRLDVVQEEDLQELLAQCEGAETLRPMPVQSAMDGSDGLPWYVNCILRISRYCCRC